MFTSPPIGRFPANPVRAVEDGLGEILAQQKLDQRHPLLVAGHRRMRAASKTNAAAGRIRKRHHRTALLLTDQTIPRFRS